MFWNQRLHNDLKQLKDYMYLEWLSLMWIWRAERLNSLIFPWVVALLGLSVSCGPSLQGSPDWLGSDESPLEGFTWRGGSERDTTGILLWSEPFFCRTRAGEEVGYLFCCWFVNLVTKLHHLWHCNQARSWSTGAVSAFICICHRKLCCLSLGVNFSFFLSLYHGNQMLAVLAELFNNTHFLARWTANNLYCRHMSW